MHTVVEPNPGGRERAVLLGALGKSPAERAAFLEAACGGDAGLRQRIETLLRAQEGLDRFLETPALDGVLPAGPSAAPPTSGLLAAVPERPGDRIGRYKLLQKIGEGGCGVVYMAEQEEPVRRRVALKVIKLGMDTRGVIARFEAERQALAMMDHPNMARVFDAGATETGRPYFVMELVRGIKITDYCNEHELSTKERLELFIHVCHAIQHAHQKGIIHRDIKPSNILVTLHDGRPVPKVIDFGIAKATAQRLTDKTLFTAFTAFLGTPAYMSPEQAEMSGLDIDTRSDIYSLGVLLYEVLTGRPPFDPEALFRAGLDECRRTLREEEPPRPSTRLATMLERDLTTAAQQRRTDSRKLIHLLRGDLDWVVMKCLEKDRTRRYETASDLAADLLRHLESEPVLARPPSQLYRFQKFVRRRRGAVVAVSAVLVTLLAGAALSTYWAVSAGRAEAAALSLQQQETQLRRQAEQEKNSARLNEYIADVNLVQQSLAAGNYGRAMQLLEKHRPQAGQPDLRGFAWRYLWQICQGDEHAALPDQESAVQSVAVSPDGRWLVIGLFDKFHVWDLRAQSLAATVPKGVVSMVFAPDGQTLFTASSSITRAWRVRDWTEVKTLQDHPGPIALSKDGTRLATASRDGVRVLDTGTWEELKFLPGARAPMSFAPDGQKVATDARGGLTVWSLTGVTEGLVLPDSTNLFSRGGPWFKADRVLAFSPDGALVLAARNALSARGVFVLSFWDAVSGREMGVMPEDPEHIEHTGAISCLAFSPDGRTLATGSLDHSIRLWNLANRQRVAALQGNLTEVWSLAFTPDGQSLVSGAKDGGVKLWPTHRAQKDDVLAGDWQPLAFSPDGRTLAAVSRGTAALLNLNSREPEQQFQLEPSRFGPQASVSISGDLKFMAEGLRDGGLKLWNLRTRETSLLQTSGSPVSLVVLSPEGRELVTGGFGQPLRWWNLRAGTNTVLAEDGFRALFSSDGSTLATFHPGERVQFWDAHTGLLRTTVVLDPPAERVEALSPDGRVLATGASDDAVYLWDTATGLSLGNCTGHKQAVLSAVFSPDGQTLATASEDSTLKLWNLATQQELLTIRRLGGALHRLVFSPDGSLLVGARGFGPQAAGLRFYHAPPFSVTDAGQVRVARKPVVRPGPGFPGEQREFPPGRFGPPGGRGGGRDGARDGGPPPEPR